MNETIGSISLIMNMLTGQIYQNKFNNWSDPYKCIWKLVKFTQTDWTSGQNLINKNIPIG